MKNVIENTEKLFCSNCDKLLGYVEPEPEGVCSLINVQQFLCESCYLGQG